MASGSDTYDLGLGYKKVCQLIRGTAAILFYYIFRVCLHSN